MQNKFTSRSKHLDFIILDLICIEVSYWLAYYIRLGRLVNSTPGEYTMMNIMVILIHLSIMFISEGYSGILMRNAIQELKKVVIHNAEMFAVILFILFFAKQSSVYSRILFALFVVIDTITMYIVRLVRKKVLYSNEDKERGKGQMLIVTNHAHAQSLVKGLAESGYRNYLIHGIVILDKDMTGQKIDGIDVVADAGGMYEYVKSNIIDEIFLEYDGEGVAEITKRFLAMGVVVHVSINNILPGTPNAAVENISHYTVITTSINIMSFKQKVIKRLMDIGVSIIGIAITAILFVIFAPIIFIQSPGPIFFKQERVGKNGRRFKIYKFRSMYMDAEERKKELMAQNKMSDGRMFKLDFDPRVIGNKILPDGTRKTGIGEFIRKTSLDEFPQFWNVLNGSMSLVGTRPILQDELRQYELHHRARIAIKPGITGMWQVSGRSDITDFEEVVRLDTEYISNWNFSLDIKILFKTVFMVLKREGSV